MPHMSILNGKDHTFINPYSYLLLRKNRPTYLHDQVFKFGYDGIALVWLLRLLGEQHIQRTSFDDTSLAPEVFFQCANQGLTLGLIGSSPGIATKAAHLLRKRLTGLQFEFVSDGYYSPDLEQSLLKEALDCDVLLCSMGTPRQEDFLIKLRAIGWKGTGFTCGGYLDQLVSAEGGAYYPCWIDKLNLRWLYRIWKEPKRLLKRYVIDYPTGLTVFTYDFLQGLRLP